ncbi:copper chaperone PCu(A)C [Zhongshania sp.]|uniref:copper chaperone PCu(A)C n=1 Tax=Zhongshania sp. TaxID=1971902 RepID=UPI0035646DB2
MNCKRMRGCLVVTLLLSGVLQAQPDQITVENAYVRGLPPSQRNTAAFFSVHNHRDQAIKVIAGHSDAAETLEIHGHQHRNGMMSMQREDEVTVAPGGVFAFAPGAYHLMLINLTRPLADGDKVQFTLKTSAGELIVVDAPVVSVLKPAPSDNTSTSKMGSTEHTGMH